MGPRQLLPAATLRLGHPGREGLSAWSWGPKGQQQRVVKVAVLHEDGGLVARVWGLDGKAMTLLEERTGVVDYSWANKGHVGHVAFADGTRWELARGGCGCGSPLKRFNPLRTS